jgi:hypothetical protein
MGDLQPLALPDTLDPLVVAVRRSCHSHSGRIAEQA